jgi:2-polyprenyl-3-methyl-5-hydroxy-6-metoxy-1,4-benzoquinol methylase
MNVGFIPPQADLVQMTDRSRAEVEAAERAFFAQYYRDGTCNPTGARLRFARELRWVLKLLAGRGGARVLSVGCGDGLFERLLAPHVAAITALDLSGEAIAAARRLAAEQSLDNVEFRCQSLRELEWRESFDLVVCLSFLHHLPPAELAGFLAAACEHLTPAGLFVAQDPNRRGWLRKIGRRVLGGKYDSYHSPDERELDPIEIRAMARSAGFSDVRLGCLDSTLIPSMYLLAKGPAWPMYVCLAVDWLWRHTPLAPWASAFTLVARKSKGSA